MKKMILIIVLIAPIVWGCAGLRKDLIQITEEDKLNAETAKTCAKNLLSTWMINSGFVRGGLGPERMAALPLGVIKAMDELDALALKQPPEYSDYELGYSLGLRVRLLSEIVAQALKTYAPELIKYAPMVF